MLTFFDVRSFLKMIFLVALGAAPLIFQNCANSSFSADGSESLTGSQSCTDLQDCACTLTIDGNPSTIDNSVAAGSLYYTQDQAPTSGYGCDPIQPVCGNGLLNVNGLTSPTNSFSTTKPTCGGSASCASTNSNPLAQGITSGATAAFAGQVKKGDCGFGGFRYIVFDPNKVAAPGFQNAAYDVLVTDAGVHPAPSIDPDASNTNQAYQYIIPSSALPTIAGRYTIRAWSYNLQIMPSSPADVTLCTGGLKDTGTACVCSDGSTPNGNGICPVLTGDCKGIDATNAPFTLANGSNSSTTGYYNTSTVPAGQVCTPLLVSCSNRCFESD